MGSEMCIRDRFISTKVKSYCRGIGSLVYYSDCYVAFSRHPVFGNGYLYVNLAGFGCFQNTIVCDRCFFSINAACRVGYDLVFYCRCRIHTLDVVAQKAACCRVGIRDAELSVLCCKLRLFLVCNLENNLLGAGVGCTPPQPADT